MKLREITKSLLSDDKERLYLAEVYRGRFLQTRVFVKSFDPIIDKDTTNIILFTDGDPCDPYIYGGQIGRGLEVLDFIVVDGKVCIQ